MPQRLLRPAIRQSKRWNQSSYFEQSLYIRLLTLVDDYGRYEADPELLKSEAFPYGDPDGKCQQMTAVDRGLLALASRDMLALYVVDGIRFLQLTRWKERVRTTESKYPGPEKGVLLSNADICQQMSASPPSPSPSPSPSPLRGGPPTPQNGPPSKSEFAEVPDWNEFWTYCQTIGMHGEAYAFDKFQAAAQDNWVRQRNWRAYAARVKTWWEEKDRPMGKPGEPATAQSAVTASPYVLEQLRKRKVEDLNDMEDDADADDAVRRDPAKRAQRKLLRAQIKSIDEQLDRAAGLIQ